MFYRALSLHPRLRVLVANPTGLESIVSVITMLGKPLNQKLERDPSQDQLQSSFALNPRCKRGITPDGGLFHRVHRLRSTVLLARNNSRLTEFFPAHYARWPMVFAFARSLLAGSRVITRK